MDIFSIKIVASEQGRILRNLLNGGLCNSSRRTKFQDDLRTGIQSEFRNSLQSARACTIPEVNFVGNLDTNHDQGGDVGQDPQRQANFQFAKFCKINCINVSDLSTPVILVLGLN